MFTPGLCPQLRFGAAKPRLSERELRYLVDVDHHDHEALVALACDTGEVVAVARYVRLPGEPGAAEVAVERELLAGPLRLAA